MKTICDIIQPTSKQPLCFRRTSKTVSVLDYVKMPECVHAFLNNPCVLQYVYTPEDESAGVWGPEALSGDSQYTFFYELLIIFYSVLLPSTSC